MPDILTMGDVTVDVIEGNEVNQVIQEKKEMRINCSRKSNVTLIGIDYKDFAYVDEKGVATEEITGIGYVRVMLNDEGLRRLIGDLVALLPEQEE